MMSLEGNLRQIICDKPSSVVWVVGAGVPQGALRGTPSEPYTSWAGLLRSGLQRIYELGKITADERSDHERLLGHSSLNSWLAVAETIMQELGAPASGEFRLWLRETVGEFVKHLADRAVLEALAEHQNRGGLLATTNYDFLLETVTGLQAVTWREPADVERALRNEDPQVLHLHGTWRSTDSVVLGIRSYDEIVRDPHAQAVLTTLRTSRTFVFVGCGAGLHDPHIGAFLKWTANAYARSEYRHFRLCRKSEVEALRREHPDEQRIFPLSYGEDHAALAPFLRSLLPATPTAAATAGTAAPPARSPVSTSTVASAAATSTAPPTVTAPHVPADTPPAPPASAHAQPADDSRVQDAIEHGWRLLAQPEAEKARAVFAEILNKDGQRRVLPAVLGMAVFHGLQTQSPSAAQWSSYLETAREEAVRQQASIELRRAVALWYGLFSQYAERAEECASARSFLRLNFGPANPFTLPIPHVVANLTRVMRSRGPSTTRGSRPIQGPSINGARRRQVLELQAYSRLAAAMGSNTPLPADDPLWIGLEANDGSAVWQLRKQTEIEAIRAKAEEHAKSKATLAAQTGRARDGYINAVRALYAELTELAAQMSLTWTQGDDALLEDVEAKGRFTAPGSFVLHGLSGKLILRPDKFVRTLLPAGGFGGLKAIVNSRSADICYHPGSDRLIYPNGDAVDAFELIKQVSPLA